MYFSNIPGTYTLGKRLAGRVCNTSLDELLTDPFHQPTVRVARTVTGNLSNQNRPLLRLMDGVLVNPTVRMLEKFQGLPASFSDGAVSQTARRKLLGKTFSVHVLRELLRPLTEFFCTR